MKYTSTTSWVYPNIHIRNRRVEYYDFDGDLVEDIEFQIFKRPYLWGLLGKKKWTWSITTNSYNVGLSFSESLL